MSKIVYTWELGAGSGHVGPLRPLAERLLDEGHELILVVKDLARAAAFFSDLDVRLYQAPVKLGRAVPYNPAPATFAHLLNNMGYRVTNELAAMLAAWRNLFHAIEPDLLLFDHSPTAMLAARGREIPQLTIGTGFCCPINEFPLPSMAPWRALDHEQRERNETELGERINRILGKFGQPTIQGIGQIYGDMDVNLLTTFPELDHYPQRTDGVYLGTWPGGTHSSPRSRLIHTDLVREWPQGDKPKIFAYLKPSKAVPDLLRWISGQGFPALIVGDGLDHAQLAPALSANVQLHARPLPMDAVCRWCDVAILNGSHGTTCSLLFAGKPLLQIPLTLEQALTAAQTVELGVALDASPDQPRQAVQQLNLLVNSAAFRDSARGFAEKHRSFSPSKAIDACIDHLQSALQGKVSASSLVNP